ncbi:MAG: M23 family metallopeptidase [Dehalococcoidia bacterium]|nr:M23 family metallopeptidase [Dehalococcoidia bacterium]
MVRTNFEIGPKFGGSTGLSTFFIVGNSSELVIYNIGTDIEVSDFSIIEAFFGFWRKDYSGQLQQCYKFYLDTSARIYAPCDGVVKAMEYQPYTQDYSVVIKPKTERLFDFGATNWHVELDHVKNPQVKVGSKVKAGQFLGNPGALQNGDGRSIGMFELDIKNNLQGYHYAPFMFLSPDAKASYKPKIEALVNEMKSRELRTNEGEIVYDDNSTCTVYPGCWLDRIEVGYYHAGQPGYRPQRDD